MTERPLSRKQLKVIFAHDWLTGMRGGERVLELLCGTFPNAPVYTLLHNPKAISAVINSHPVFISRLQHLPLITSYYRRMLPFFPVAIEHLRPEPADLLISVSHCVAKGLKPRKGTLHLCYCLTPMRYAWVFYEEYFGHNPLKKIVLEPFLRRLRTWDKSASDRVDHFVALSRHVQRRIRKFYGRESDIVYPPVKTQYWTPAPPGQTQDNKNTYDLIVSALVPYKRVDLAVKAYNRSGERLIIAGTGPELPRLRAASSSNIEFIGWVPDERLRELYRHCRALIFPGEEDFGIVPVEVQACGRPVIAYAKGGALETVKEGATGIFFKEQTGEALLNAIERCTATKWNSAAIRAHAEQFGEEHFIAGMTASIEKCLNHGSTA